MATVAAYFNINTGSSEREAEIAAQSIFRSFSSIKPNQRSFFRFFRKAY